MSQKINHIHRYKKVDLSRTKGKEYLVYRCTKPLCSHYIPVVMSEGKMCECNRCGEPMIITREVLIHSENKPMARPHCPNCIKRKKNESVDKIAEFLSKTGI